jgi:hypothetical protein
VGSLDIDPKRVPAWVPDFPPISTCELAVGLVGLFGKADGLALPGYVSIYQPSQAFMLQFASSEVSLSALAAWAQRFGAVLVSEDDTDQQGRPRRYVRIVFEFFGVEVTAYAFIPVTQTGT